MILLGAGLAGAAVGVLGLGTFHPRVPLFGPILWHGRRDRPLVSLTFDDGPHPDYTPGVMAAMARVGWRGTFFCLGVEAERTPSLVKELAAAGHSIGNHTYSHDMRTHLFSKRALAADLARCQDILGPLLGRPPDLYRPSVGIRNPAVHGAARALGLRVVTWAQGPRDGYLPLTREKMLALAARIRPGDIIALHDGLWLTERAVRQSTVDHLPALIEALQARGLSSVPVPELVG